MNPRITTKGRSLAAAAALALTGGLVAALPAAAAPPDHSNASAKAECAGPSVPASKISIQLYSYWGWQRDIGIEGVLAELSDIGIKNVEPFGASYEGNSPSEFRDLLKSYGMKAPSSHGSTNEANFASTLDDAKDLGQKYVGSGGFASPGIGSYENTLATAETMNRLGEQSVKNGTGQFFGHNHASEFTTQYEDPETGEMKSAWQILVENTDPRYVAFQLDVYWAISGGADPVELLNTYGDRIDMLHIKDGFAPYGRGDITDVGEGDIDWAPILEAAQGKISYYVLERDGAPSTAEFAQDSFEFLTCFTY